MNEKINGFLLLRKSLKNLPPYNTIFKIDDKEYRGFVRGHLEDILDDYFQNKLSPELTIIVKKNFEESNFLPPVALIRGYDDAVKLFKYANEKNELNEIAVIQSSVLEKSRGSFDFEGSKIEWLGYDIVIFGGSSLILEGLFSQPQYFERWRDIINDNGLFSKADLVNEYLQDYQFLAKKNIIEPYELLTSGYDLIRIGVLV